VNSNPAYVSFKLANIWQAKGKITRAIAGYQQTISLQPEFVPAYLELAKLMMRLERIEEAIAVYKEAIARNPQEMIFQQYLAEIINRDSLRCCSSDRLFNNFQPIGKQGNKLGHILFYTDCYGTYGAEQCHHLLMLNFLKANYQITCAQSYASHYLISQRTQLGIEHLWLEFDNIYHPTIEAKAFTNFDEAEKVFQLVRPDLIIFSDGCPLSHLAAKEVAIKLGIPYLIIVHCVYDDWAKRFALHLERLPNIYRQAQQVIAVSQQNLQLLRQKFKLPEDLGRVIYNGRPQEYFQETKPQVRDRLRQELGIPQSGIVLFTAGRLELAKGYQYQMKAIARLEKTAWRSRLYCVWCGTGTLESQLRVEASLLDNPKRILFLGKRDDLANLLDLADIFILPSQFEGMPLSIMEAMAKGLPVIASAVSGIPEELGDTGKLIPDPNIDPELTIRELVATIQLWSEDLQLRQSIGKSCRKRAEKMFQAAKMFEEYLKLIN
jgi:glycosyltransferase involved in cell wall biosynthesis